MPDIKDYDVVRKEAERFFSGIGHVGCPALKAHVHFTSEGFNHLRYSKKRVRSQVDQIAKFKLLKKAKILLETTTTIQEYSERNEEVHKKRHKKLSKEWTMVGYWGFIAIINGVRLKVVVKRIENSKYLFWSVIPVWQTKDFQGTKIMDKSKGDLAED